MFPTEHTLSCDVYHYDIWKVYIGHLAAQVLKENYVSFQSHTIRFVQYWVG